MPDLDWMEVGADTPIPQDRICFIDYFATITKIKYYKKPFAEFVEEREGKAWLLRRDNIDLPTLFGCGCERCERVFKSKEKLEKHVCMKKTVLHCEICGYVVSVPGDQKKAKKNAEKKLATHKLEHAQFRKGQECQKCPWSISRLKFDTEDEYTEHHAKTHGVRSDRWCRRQDANSRYCYDDLNKYGSRHYHYTISHDEFKPGACPA